MTDPTDIERLNEAWQHKFEELGEEWRRKFEELGEVWQRRLREMGETMIALVDLMRDVIVAGNPNAETIEKMRRVAMAGLTRLRAINSAAEAERDPGAPLN